MSAWTQADLDVIDRAIARGEKTVQYSDRSVTYRGTDELLQARALIAATLAAAPRVRQGISQKGL